MVGLILLFNTLIKMSPALFWSRARGIVNKQIKRRGLRSTDEQFWGAEINWDTCLLHGVRWQHVQGVRNIDCCCCCPLFHSQGLCVVLFWRQTNIKISWDLSELHQMLQTHAKRSTNSSIHLHPSQSTFVTFRDPRRSPSVTSLLTTAHVSSAFQLSGGKNFEWTLVELNKK